MVLIRTVPTLLSPLDAVMLAKVLQADQEDDWTYDVEHAPDYQGLSKVVVFDDDGEKIGYL